MNSAIVHNELCIMSVKISMYVCNEVHAYMCECAFRVEREHRSPLHVRAFRAERTL